MARDIENSRFHKLLVCLVLGARISSFYYTRILEQKSRKKQGASWENMGLIELQDPSLWCHQCNSVFVSNIN